MTSIFSCVSQQHFNLILGSQVVARSKREHTTQTRNDLIDKQMLQQNNNEDAESGILSQDGSNYDEMKRRNSYDTDSTGIDVDDKATTSEASDEHRKPRWHPPWQLKQVIPLSITLQQSLE